MATKKKKAKKTKELGLEDILMNCRNILRGKASLATRRDTILTLVFLKFISEKFIKQREAITKDIESRNANNDGENKRNIPVKDFLEVDYSYRKNGVFYLPKECRWESILNTDSNKVALALDNICSMLDHEEVSLHGALPQKIFTDSRIEPEFYYINIQSGQFSQLIQG